LITTAPAETWYPISPGLPTEKIDGSTGSPGISHCSITRFALTDFVRHGRHPRPFNDLQAFADKRKDCLIGKSVTL
jgi:hypothetical protein